MHFYNYYLLIIMTEFGAMRRPVNPGPKYSIKVGEGLEASR